MQITVSEAIPSDIAWLISCHGEQYSDEFHFSAEFESDIAKKVSAFLERQSEFNKLWIACTNNERIASIAVSEQANQTAFINFLLVKKKYRGHGVAKKLLDLLIAHATEYGMQSVRLETYSCLTNARHLYRLYGFHADDIRPQQFRYGVSFDQEFWEKKL